MIGSVPASLHWLPIRCRINYKVLLFQLLSSLEWLSPAYLLELLCFLRLDLQGLQVL